MKKLSAIYTSIFLSFAMFAMSTSAQAQCATSGGPTYSNSCTGQYFTAINASGTGVASTITVSGVTSCLGTYFNNYVSMGINTYPNNTVFMNLTRNAGAAIAYASVYVDWNNNGTYETSELAGTLTPWAAAVTSLTYSFVVPPASAVVTATNLHMRVMLSQTTSGAPCTANWGQTYDFYMQVNNCISSPVSVSPTVASRCFGGPAVNLNATGAGGGGSYFWYPSTGLSSASIPNPTASPLTTTSYTVTGYNASGCPDTAVTTVIVNPLPSAISGTSSMCAASTTTLTATPGGGTWSSGSTTIATVGAGTGVVFSQMTAGMAPITYTLPTGCRSITSVAVNRVIPTISLTPFPGSTVCIGTNVTFTPTVTNEGTSPTYLWKVNNVNVAISPTYTYMPLDGDVVYCRVTSNAPCALPDTARTTLTMNADPIVTPYVTIGSQYIDSICTGTIDTLTALPVHGGSAPIFQWWKNGVFEGAGTNYVYTPVAGDLIRLKMTSNAACRYRDTANDFLNLGIVAYQTPTITVTASPSDTVCMGDYVTYTATTNWGGLAPRYWWTVNDTFVSDALNYTYVPVTGDIVRFHLISNYPCVTADSVVSVNPVKVHSYPMPTAHLTVTPGYIIWPGTNATFTVHTVGTTPYLTYQWYVNGVPRTGATLSYFISSTLSNRDSVACEVTDYGYCRNFSIFAYARIFINTNVGVNELTNEGNNVRLYPNPNTGNCQLDFTSMIKETLSVSVSDMTGREISKTEWNVEPGNNVLPMDMSHLAKGVYFTKIYSATGGQQTIKTVIE